MKALAGVVDESGFDRPIRGSESESVFGIAPIYADQDRRKRRGIAESMRVKNIAFHRQDAMNVNRSSQFV